MSDLTEFLLARLDEDEGWLAEPDVQLLQWRIARLKAECAARRDLIEWALGVDTTREYGEHSIRGEDVLRIMAAAYANHPDYREAWRLDTSPRETAD